MHSNDGGQQRGRELRGHDADTRIARSCDLRNLPTRVTTEAPLRTAFSERSLAELMDVQPGDMVG